MQAAALERTWPPSAIRIRSNRVALRPVREDDLADLAAMVPGDVEFDPESEMFSGLDLDANRRRLFLQSYWRSRGSWSVGAWWLPFLVEAGDRAVGVQTLEAQRFPELRVVDSSSWLRPDARGRGIGTAMRAAILSLSFEHLGARYAVSSAREDNEASRSVSRHLGYEDNGVSRSRSPSGPCTLHHVILSRHAWRASEWCGKATVEGLEGCAPWFGVDVQT